MGGPVSHRAQVEFDRRTMMLRIAEFTSSREMTRMFDPLQAHLAELSQLKPLDLFLISDASGSKLALGTTDPQGSNGYPIVLLPKDGPPTYTRYQQHTHATCLVLGTAIFRMAAPELNFQRKDELDEPGSLAVSADGVYLITKAPLGEIFVDLKTGLLCDVSRNCWYTRKWELGLEGSITPFETIYKSPM